MPAAEFYGFLCGGGDAHFLPSVFLELGGENAVFPQGAAAPLQLTAHAGVEVVAVDNQLQVATRLGKGVAQLNYIKKMVKTDSGLCNVCRKYQSHVCHDCIIIERVKIWEQSQFVPYYI